jgi:hypothetical protein
MHNIVIIALILFSILLWVGIPFSIKKFRKYYEKAYEEPEQDFNKLNDILDNRNNSKEIGKYLNELRNKKHDRIYWFWEGGAIPFWLYWIVTLMTTILLLVKLKEIFKI